MQVIETARLILRSFTGDDLDDLYALLRDEEVNRFLPWFPAKSPEDARAFYEERFRGREAHYAVCLRGDGRAIGYVNAELDGSNDFGYALRREFWHRGITSEAAAALVERLRRDGVPYITATHDVNNPRSGAVMRRIGMKYRYTYLEQWMPKNFPVYFRLYQLNFDGNDGRVYGKYRETSPEHFVEEGL